MTVTEEQRLNLHRRLQEVLGREEAMTFMELVPPVGWADVATKRDLDHQDVVFRSELSGQVAQMRAEMHEGFAAVHRDMRVQLLTILAFNLSMLGVAVGFLNR